MIGWRFALFAALFEASSSVAAGLSCGDASLIEMDAEPARVEIDALPAWQLVIDERGIDAAVTLGESGVQQIDLRPPRLGRKVLAGRGRVSVAIERRSEGSGSVYAQLECKGETGECLSGIENALKAGDWDALRRESDPYCKTFARHAETALLSRAGRLRELAVRYRDLVSEWSARNEPELSAAARLGYADALMLMGQSQSSEREAGQAIPLFRQLDLPYYEVRALESVGIARAYQGDPAGAERAYASALALAEQWNEPTAAINVRVNLGSLHRVWGNFDAAREQLAVLDKTASKLTPVAEGRRQLLTAELALISGDIEGALEAATASRAAFETAKAAVWIGTADAQRGRIMAGLGLRSEAYASFASALKITPAADAPIRTARILLDVAESQLVDGKFDSAATLAQQAGEIYAHMGLPIESGWAALLTNKALVGAKRPAMTYAEFTKAHPVSGSTSRSCLYGAAEALGAKEPERAMAMLDMPHCAQRGLSDWIESERLESQALVALGRVAEGQARLLDAGTFLQRQAGQGSLALGQSLRRQIRQLEHAYVDQLPAPTVEDLWRWWQATDFLRGYATTVANAPALSEWVGRSILGPDPSAPHVRSDHELLRALSTGAAVETRAAGLTLDALRAEMPTDTWLLRIFQGDTSSYLLWISRDRSFVQRLPGRISLRADLSKLMAALATVSDMNTANRLAAEFGALVFTSVPTADAPKHLYVAADGLSESIPWAALHWPSSGERLLTSTTVSIVPGFWQQAQGEEHELGELNVLVAARPAAALAPLLVADNEPNLIRSALDGSRLNVGFQHDVDRDDVLSALKKPQIVHVAAHGAADPTRLGFAGLWLSSAKADSGFLSWMDLPRVTSPLVVLNACSLATSFDVTQEGNLSFASAVAFSGGKNVVAALWPVSDAATNVWVPEFYTQLDPKRPETSAEALRLAQLKLANSRYFSHPHYWASLVHIAQVSVPPPK